MTFFKHTAMLIIASGLLVSLGCKNEKSSAETATFFFESVKVQQVLPEEFNSWGYPKKKLFNFMACPKDLAVMAPIIGQTFEVRDESAGIVSRATDSRGCIQWEEHHEYDHFAPETFMRVKRIIVGTGSHKGAIEVSLALNPWADQVLDLRYDYPQQLDQPAKPVQFQSRLIEGKALAAALDLKALNLQFLNIDYSKWEVDPQLRLTVAHNYRMRLTPTVIRKGLKTPTITETPVVGRARLTLVVLTEGQDQKASASQYVTHYTGTVNLAVGGAIEDITLKFPDTIAEVASRMRAFVKLEPLVDSPSVGPALLTSPIGPLPSMAALQLVPTDVDAELLLASVNAIKASSITSSTKPTDLFAQLSGFRQLKDSLSEEQKSVSRSKEIDLSTAKALLSSSGDKEKKRLLPQLHRRLCQEVYGSFPPNALVKGSLEPEPEKRGLGRFFGGSKPRLRNARDVLEHCFAHPQNAMTLEVRELVESLQSPVVRRSGLVQSETLSIQNQFSISDSVSKTDGETRRWTKFGYTLDGSLSAGLGFDLGWGLADWKPSPATEPGGLAGAGSTILGGIGGAKASFGGKIGAGARTGWSQDWFWSYARSIDERTSNSVTATMTRSVVVEAYALKVDVTAKKCMIVAPILIVEGQQDRGVFFCAEDLEKKTATEAYYLVNQPGTGTSPVVDGASSAEMPWRMFIRGAHMYNKFKGTVGDARIELVMEPLSTEEEETRVGKKAKEVFLHSRMTEDFPGMLTPPLLKK